MTGICNGASNKVLEPFFSYVAKAAQTITKANKFVKKLVVFFFVQNVESPALAALFPAPSRGLNDPAQEVIRTCRLIVWKIQLR